ncbi:SNF2 family N-terminal domain-containing protein [Suillus clintonianus]|uniref:SNF2 family N-terminal domain-containing protein n=1 Tax=Suillus clintonianus TaxID=1904413 RepID=UPI001B86D063|nr:SNF2 family N-terminal domain-containing protein [Suillus clintonianus]KAG2126297.1 SNF2 family N-terminal domain-containing protein [Suillus clintonianus]
MVPPKHSIDYSRSPRSVCKGPAPCNGAPISVGSLRYGQLVPGEYGETVAWRHWGCVTPDILRSLAVVDQSTIIGFGNIRPEDQAKVRRAMANQRVDLSDVPLTAKATIRTAAHVAPCTSQAPAPGQKKRKATFEQPAPANSQLSSVKPAIRSTVRYDEDEDDEVTIIESDHVDVLYCTLSSSIVGVQYYKGLVGPGEEVRLVREPQNKYDRNAIEVQNIGGTKVGHVPKQTAAKLAPLLDRGMITIEGVMHEGNLSGFSYSLSMTLKIYGPSDKRDQLEPQLIWATPRQRGFPPRGAGGAAGQVPFTAAAAAVASSSYTSQPTSSQRHGNTATQSKAQQEAIRKQQEAVRKQQKAAELKQKLSGLEKVDDEGRRASLLDDLCSVDDILNLPIHPNPPGVASGDLVVDLLKHQSQALQWCIDHEYPSLPTKESDKPVQFWQYKKAGSKPYYFNIATKTPQEITSPPLLGRGAILADSMGLGKTLTMLALILATKKDVPTGHSKSTLIVVPLSVISNWEKQIEEHCVRGAMSTYTYYGATRDMTPKQLSQYDVVITTYQTVTGEADVSASTAGDGPSKKKKKVERALFEVKWKRVILDEGHTIRNPKTKMAKAVCKLTAQRRWALSGTPIINSPRDLGSILTFLQICRPLDNEDFYKRLLLRPLKDGDPSGAELLRALMSHACIRRTKEMQDSLGKPLVPLPPVDITVIPVPLGDEARALYDAIWSVSQQRAQKFMNQQGGMTAMFTTNILSMLTRLRQVALHPGLLPPNYLEQLRATEDNEESVRAALPVTQDQRRHLQSLLAQAIEDNVECPICFDVLNDPRITACSHPFCLACISEVIARDPKCPMDRRTIGMGDLIEPPPPTELTQAPVRRDENETHDTLRTGSSAKIDQLIHLLQLIPSDQKSLVFSQFTSFLDKIGEALEEHGIPYVRFDGQLSARRRKETLERFSIPLEAEEDLAVDVETPIPSSRRRTSTHTTLVEDDVLLENDDSSLIVDDDDDDDDFEEDLSTRAKKGKGKSKPKNKGKAKARYGTPTSQKARLDGSSFGGEIPRVMLISLKAGSLGLNLTVANNVILMDPWWQEGIESQAIDRCNRIGQKRPVHVYQLIAENTVESKVIEIQERKKLLIQQAFAGTKRTETQRQKKEARLQDIMEFFGGIRQQPGL